MKIFLFLQNTEFRKKEKHGLSKETFYHVPSLNNKEMVYNNIHRKLAGFQKSLGLALGKYVCSLLVGGSYSKIFVVLLGFAASLDGKGAAWN